MTSALSRMVGGSHYLKNGIQPVEFIAANRWDFFLGSSLKYLTRWRDKGGVIDLGKYKHFIELREATMPVQPWPCVMTHEIPMSRYIEANRVPLNLEAAALMALEAYAFRPSEKMRESLFALIDAIISAESA